MSPPGLSLHRCRTLKAHDLVLFSSGHRPQCEMRKGEHSFKISVCENVCVKHAGVKAYLLLLEGSGPVRVWAGPVWWCVPNPRHLFWGRLTWTHCLCSYWALHVHHQMFPCMTSFDLQVCYLNTRAHYSKAFCNNTGIEIMFEILQKKSVVWASFVVSSSMGPA